jgi:hypothetical protein
MAVCVGGAGFELQAATPMAISAAIAKVCGFKKSGGLMNSGS